MSRLTLRLQALLLATIFVAGNFGFADLDALLRHRSLAAVGQTRTHFETQGSCADHQGHCQLGRLLANASGQVAAEAPSLAHSILPHTPPRFWPECRTTQAPNPAYHSRAPPALIG